MPRMRWLPRMRCPGMRRLPRMRWLSRLRGLQGLPMRCRLWRLRRWLYRRRRAVGRNRLLCILGTVSLVLGNDSF